MTFKCPFQPNPFLWFYDWCQKVSYAMKIFWVQQRESEQKQLLMDCRWHWGGTGLRSNSHWKWEMGRSKAYGFYFHYGSSPGQGWRILLSVKRTCTVLYKVYMLSQPCKSQKWNWETNKSERTCSVSAQTNSPLGPYQHTWTLITLLRSADHRLLAVTVTFYHARKLLANR